MIKSIVLRLLHENSAKSKARRTLPLRRRECLHNAEHLEPRVVLAAGIAVADFQFTNHGLDGQTELFSRDLHADSTTSDITSPQFLGSTGNGEPPRGLALGSAYSETTEPTPATNSTDFFTFTITPAAGKPLSLSDLSFYVRRNDPDSKNSFSVYFDEDPGAGGDNFTTRLVAGVVANEDTFEQTVVSLEGRPEFTNLTTPITFRYYAWGTAGVGTQRIDNIRVRAIAENVSGSAFAYFGDANRLINPLDAQGNRVSDFSAAGYRNGNEPIPDVAGTIDAARIINVSPVDGDDMASIQAAIDTVAAMSPDTNGFRGVVQLSAGEFEISDQIQILESGIVLRGVGDGNDPASNTILRGTGTLERTLVRVGPASGFASGTGGTRNVVDKYVPVGATSFRLDSTADWAVGDEIIVRRPSTEEWITALGMDAIPPRSDGNPITQWEAGSYDELYERVITRIDGDRIHINAPLQNSLDQQYGGGTVFRYTFPRISDVGIENVRGVSDFASDTDEQHARSFIELQAVEDAWVTNVTGQHFVYATVHATLRSMRVTVDDARSLEPKSVITGGRRYPFVIDGQFILMQNLYSEEGRHDFVNNSRQRNRGPNVFLNGAAVDSNSSTGPHQRFSTGTLYDTITTDNETEARNRGNFGSGHGWAGANMVFWNNVAARYKVQNPPTAQNWLIGSVGTIANDTTFGQQPDATVDAHGTPIDFEDAANPLSSLYVAQRNQVNYETGLERREYVLGDFDLMEFDGATSDDAVVVDPDWSAAITAVAGATPIEISDEITDGHFVPFTFEFPVETGDAVFSAVLTLGLSGTGGNASDDAVYLDSVSDVRPLTSLGLSETISDDQTTPLTFELTGSDLELLNDGRLNLAISENTALDWAHLDLRVGAARGLTIDIAESSISKEGGSTTATITRSGETNHAMVVTLTNSDPGEVSIPASVTIPAGQTMATFTIDAVNDGIHDCTQATTITATAVGQLQGQASLNTTPRPPRETLVSSAAEITAALPNLVPGDTLVMTNGTWTDQHIDIAGIGCDGEPITLRAETPGLVVLDGDSTLSISGDWIVVDGVRFDGGALNSGSVVEFRGSLGEATNSRFTNSAIVNYNPADINTRYFWVSLYGEHNRVDHNYFHGQNHSGVTVVVWRDSGPDHHRIDGNHFADRPEGNANGFETIRIGTSTDSLSDSFTVVENNLFERVDGEIEIISNKSGSNIFRHNTFRESAGTLTLRQGNDNRVEGNWFLGEGKDRSGGVRVIGERQTIINNYFHGLDGRADGAIAITAGVPNSELAGYFQVKDALIAHNTIVDVNDAAITFSQGLGSSGRTLLAEDVTIANNLIQSSQDQLFSGSEGTNWTWEGNIAFGEALGPADSNPGISTAAPLLVADPDGIWRPDFFSPAIDGGAGDYADFLTDDIDGQGRDAAFDIGSDELAASAVVRGPLTGDHTGPGLALLIAASSVNESDAVAATTATIVRNKDIAAALVVNLASSDTSEATVPATVTIPAGQASVTFSIDAVQDSVIDGTVSVTISAAATGYSPTSDTLDVINTDVPAPDLVATDFNVLTDHVVEGQAIVSLTIQNIGLLDSGFTTASFVWSANKIFGDADDVPVQGAEVFIPALAVGESSPTTTIVELDRQVLLNHSLSQDEPGQTAGAVSGDVSQLFLVVDNNNFVAELNENNNAGTGYLIDSDDITYFPWDIDGSRTVTPRDALRSIQAINSSSAAHDLDGNGIVTPLDALPVLQRIGYRIDENVLADIQTVAPTSNPKTGGPAAVQLFAVHDDDEAEGSLFANDSDSNRELIVAEDDAELIDRSFQESTDWLSLLS